MKRVLLVIVLVVIAGVAGIVRSHTRGTGLHLRLASAHQESGELREVIRKSFALSPGAVVKVSGINGSLTVETADTKTAEVYVERTGKEAGALERRKVVIESSATSLTVRGEKGDLGFFDRLFGSNPNERVLLTLPRQVAFSTNGVNGPVTIGDIAGAVKVSGVNGRVDVGETAGPAEFHGINGNLSLALRTVDKEGVQASGINGNIELRLAAGVNADFEAHGMNGSVRSDIPEVRVEQSERGHKYFAHIGTGENRISVSGSNGNIRFTRPVSAQNPAAQAVRVKNEEERECLVQEWINEN